MYRFYICIFSAVVYLFINTIFYTFPARVCPNIIFRILSAFVYIYIYIYIYVLFFDNLYNPTVVNTYTNIIYCIFLAVVYTCTEFILCIFSAIVHL